MYTKTYKSYVLYALLCVYILNFVDRQILALLMESIKADLKLSDTELGFMSGIAFAVFYTFIGIPIARLADRSHRVNIISIAIAIWSGMTVLSGMAMNFWHLVIARIGVGVGEAGCTPPAHSLIADYYDKEGRGRAISIYMMGVPLGVLVGYIVGGWLNETFGWRIAFIALGLPGLVVALLVKLTIKEPKRVIESAVDRSSLLSAPVQLPLMQSLIFLLKIKSYRRMVIAMALIAFVGAGVAQWQASFFIRNHGMNTTELGVWLALMTGMVGAVGLYLGGYFTERYAKNNEGLQLKILAFSAFMMVAPGILSLVVANKTLALCFVGLHSFFYFIHYGPAFSLLLTLVPANMRAVASAICLFVVNLIGTGVGPQFVGVFSDIFEARLPVDGLRAAMVTVYIGIIFSVWNFLLAAKTVSQDIGKSNTASSVNSALDRKRGS